jgi:hypothetical protein
MFRKHPINVTIFFPREGGHIIDHDKARRIKDRKTGKQSYKLKKYKDTIKPGQYTHVFRGVKGDELVLVSPSRGEYYQMGMYSDKIHCPGCGLAQTLKRKVLKPLNEDMKFWFINVVERAFKKYDDKTRLERYMPMILLALFGLAMVFVFWGGAQYAESIAGMSNAFASAAEALARATESLSGISITGVPLPPA